MTDIHDDLDDLDKVWCQEDPLLSRDVEVDFGVDDRPVVDDDPVVEDRPEVIEELGATLTLVILMGRLLTARQLFFMAESRRPAARRGPGAVPAAIPLANSRSEVLGELRDGVEGSRRLDHALPGTAVAFVALRYGKRLVADFQVRKTLTNLFVIAFATAVIASLLGALVNIAAPNDYMHRAWTP